jgi:hypothetical protein
VLSDIFYEPAGFRVVGFLERRMIKSRLWDNDAPRTLVKPFPWLHRFCLSDAT